MTLFCCPCALCYGWDKGEDIADDVGRCAKRNESFVFWVRLIVCLSLIGWGILIQTSSQTIWFIIGATLMSIMAFYHSEMIQMLVYLGIMLVPLIIALVIMPVIHEMVPGLFKQPRQNEANRARIEPMNREDPQIVNQQEEDKFNFVERQTTNKAMNNIMTNWRRKFSSKDKMNAECCCVGLDEFKEDENVIELKCGQNHIFHPECLESWASRNKSCPLGRTDFVELAKNEPPTIQTTSLFRPDDFRNNTINANESEARLFSLRNEHEERDVHLPQIYNPNRSIMRDEESVGSYDPRLSSSHRAQSV